MSSNARRKNKEFGRASYVFSVDEDEEQGGEKPCHLVGANPKSKIENRKSKILMRTLPRHGHHQIKKGALLCSRTICH
jgi:hypothetical protein